jgi:hypothetical protein
MIAGLLRAMNFFMGDDIDLDNNEDQRFVGVHAGDRELFLDQSRREVAVGALQKLIDERNSSHAAWGWKDPLSSYYVSDVYPALRGVKFIFIARDLVSVVQREYVEEHRGVDGAVDDAVYLAYLKNVIREYNLIVDVINRYRCPTMLVSYERALRFPENLVQQVAEFVDLPGREMMDFPSLAEYIRPDRLTARLLS